MEVIEVVDKPQSNQKKYERIQTRQWANLQHDLLNLVMRKLYLTDRIRFRAVCRNWHIPIGDRPINALPWVHYSWFYFDYNGSLTIGTNILDPVHQKTHTFPNFDRSCFGNVRICASKCGWLLLSKHKPDTDINLFFLYSHFYNNAAIMLPEFTSPDHCLNEATFSSTNPTSPYCIFFVASYDRHSEEGKIRISTYCNGENSWRTKILDGYCRGGPVQSIVCTENGVCYFVLRCGKLGAFSVASQEFSWLADSLSIKWTSMHLEVFSYDGNERGWIQQKSLGDRVLFIGYTSYLRMAIGDTADLADMIFSHYIDHNYNGNYNKNVVEIRAYSLKDGKQYKQSRAYDWIVKDLREKIWIEPPY